MKSTKGLLFEIPFFQYSCDDWLRKKKAIANALDENDFERRPLENFETDRHRNNLKYRDEFCSIFDEELQQFGRDAGLSVIRVTGLWTVRYGRGDHHIVHNHSSKGYSGILSFEFVPYEHESTVFVGPYNDPICDRTQLTSPATSEGDIVIAPSHVLHFTTPNASEVRRSIISFDMEVQ